MYFAAMEYSALYSCNFCKFNPVNRSSLILPVPKRVSFSVLMSNGISCYNELCVWPVSHIRGAGGRKRDCLCWRLYFCSKRWESRGSRVCQCCGDRFVGHKGVSDISGHTSASSASSLLSVQTVHPHTTSTGVSVFFPLQHWQQLAVVSLLQWPWCLQFLTNCSVAGCRPDAPASRHLLSLSLTQGGNEAQHFMDYLISFLKLWHKHRF